MSFKSQGTGCPINHSRKSRDTWSNRQVWPWSTKWSRAKANRVLSREHADYNKHLFPTMQETTLHMYTPDGQYRNQTYHVLCSQRWRSSTRSAKTRPGADCGSDHELLTVRFRLKLKKVGKTTRLFKYDLNQIPYDYTEEVTNRFRGLIMVDKVLEEPWTEVYNIVQNTVFKTISKEKKMQDGKNIVWGGFKNSSEEKG